MGLLTMEYSELEKEILEDNDNSLSQIVESFFESDDECWYIDRHVIQMGDSRLSSLTISFIYIACQAALVLLKTWNAQRLDWKGRPCCISVPLLIIDDEWLAACETAPPPHVYMCIAKSESSYKPVKHKHAKKVDKTENKELDKILKGNIRIYRLPAFSEDEFGAWLIEEWRDCESPDLPV